MSAPKDGGPAFPVPPVEFQEIFRGMSLRDYFAAQVLPAIFASGVELLKYGGPAQEPRSLARDCYKLADAMLAEREKSK